MSEDETIVFIFFLIVAFVIWIRWFFRLAMVTPLASPRSMRAPLYFAPLLGLAILFSVLIRFSSFDVRDSRIYIAFYLAMGAAWLGLGSLGLPLLGLNAKEDVAERANPAARNAIGGALIGIMLCFAGSNIGDGPGWWVVVFCAFLATATLFGAWILLALLCDIMDRIKIERDAGAGIRVAAFFMASSLILGRAVAGNWVSSDATIRDFAAIAWPVLILVGGEAVVERWLTEPQTSNTTPIFSLFVVLPLYLGSAAAYLYWLGPWS